MGVFAIENDLFGKIDLGFEIEGDTILFQDIASLSCGVIDSQFKIEFNLCPGSGMLGFFRNSYVFTGTRAFEIYTKYLIWVKINRVNDLRAELKKIDPRLTIVMEGEK